VEKALRPVIFLAQEKGATVLLLHHFNKSDGPEGTAHRGSGHLVAMVDIAVELRRPEDNAPESRRVLRALSRYQEMPQELVIDL
jgi:dihydrodipicolinate reductase